MDTNPIAGFKYGQKSYCSIEIWTEILLQDSNMDRNLIAGFRYGQKSSCWIQIGGEILL